ncbi:xanthine dehydrogenase family protein molybdopterin-binding subunit [Fusibacter sp. JL216-2]|uniref:xanthine dehydrogenase family protein molybdopterin-binding subunit n=1 Tax=Fusibacter sp. JL216-2 TaxID=3071453 RepID=UPI003D35775B
MTAFKTIGKRYRRKDGIDKLTGRALYPQDMHVDNMAYGHTVRSTVPHAKIKVNTSIAEEMPGVLTVLTAKDVTAMNHHGVLFKDHEVLCDKKVRRVGDPVAFVVAETEEEAESAAHAVIVEYEELPALFDPAEAMKEDAVQIHDGKSNVIYHYKCRRGDVDKAFEEADVVVENTYYSPFVDHVFLQLESGLSYMEEGRLVLVASSQYPHFDRLEIAEALGLEEEDVILRNPAVGGAFGGREDITMQIHLGLATLKTGRPVKITYTREESFYAHSKRHPMTMTMKTAATKDGKITAVEAYILGDTGAYASWAINVLRKAGVHVPGPYEVENVKVDSIAVYTNNPFCGAMRGFGATQVPIAYEQQMDMLARELGMDPFDIRYKNCFKKGSMTPNGQILTESVPMKECIDALKDLMEGADAND